jgi:zinc protease
MSVKANIISVFASCLIISSSVIAQEKNLVPIQKWQTTSGSQVLYVYEHELPIVDIQVVFDAGSARDNAKPGLAKITNDTLNAGTKSKNVDQIANAFDNVGAQFSSAVNRDMAVVAMRSLSDSKFFTPALSTFNEVLTEPTFPKEEFLRIQKQALITLNAQDESPSSIATKAFYNAVYDGAPYGHPISGTKESMSSMTTVDLQNFYKANYTAQNAIITIVGDIDQQKAKQLADNLSAHLSRGPKLPKGSERDVQQKQQFKHIVFPSSQTHVMIGQRGITRNDPTYFSVVVGNYILGGASLTSRLFDEVREKRGLAYSVGSQFSALRERGPFFIELQTRNSEAKNAIKVVNDTLTDFVSQGPSSTEIEVAKKNLTQGFILRLASNTAIISQLITIGYYQLPLNYLDTYQENIGKVTENQVKDVFKNLVHPSNMVTVTVGG